MLNKEVRCVECFNPDMPFVEYYIFTGSKVITVHEDPTDLDVRVLSIDTANVEIERFHHLMSSSRRGEKEGE